MAKQPRKYYGLVLREEGMWTWAFGDFDKECVVFERDDYRDGGVKAKDLNIVTFASVPSQAQVDELIADLNA